MIDRDLGATASKEGLLKMISNVNFEFSLEHEEKMITNWSSRKHKFIDKKENGSNSSFQASNISIQEYR